MAPNLPEQSSYQMREILPKPGILQSEETWNCLHKVKTILAKKKSLKGNSLKLRKKHTDKPMTHTIVEYVPTPIPLVTSPVMPTYYPLNLTYPLLENQNQLPSLLSLPILPIVMPNFAPTVQPYTTLVQPILSPVVPAFVTEDMPVISYNELYSNDNNRYSLDSTILSPDPIFVNNIYHSYPALEDVTVYSNVNDEYGIAKAIKENNTKELDKVNMDNVLEFYITLPKDLFPQARSLALDPNQIIDEFCKMSNIQVHTPWILDLEFGVPRSPVTRAIPIYNVKFNSISCKNAPEAIHPGFESCDPDFRRALLFYYDCVVSIWYRGYIIMNYDSSVENFQSWLLLPMQVLGMCWP